MRRPAFARSSRTRIRQESPRALSVAAAAVLGDFLFEYLAYLRITRINKLEHKNKFRVTNTYSKTALSQ